MHARSSTCGVPARRRSCSRTASSISCTAVTWSTWKRRVRWATGSSWGFTATPPPHARKARAARSVAGACASRCRGGGAVALLFADDTPLALVEAVAPDVLVKGGDYRVADIVGREIVEARGGRV